MVFQKSTSPLCANGHLRERNAHGKCRACARDRARRHNARLDPVKKQQQKKLAHQRYKLKHGDRVAEQKKNSNLRLNYGITLAEYQALFSSQGKRCAICKTDDPGNKRPWHLDHCHDTGVVRGILCAHCNVMIAMSKEDEDILQGAISYLAHHRIDRHNK